MSSDDTGFIGNMSLVDEVRNLRTELDVQRKDTDWLKAELNKMQNKFEIVYKELVTSSTKSKANFSSKVELQQCSSIPVTETSDSKSSNSMNDGFLEIEERFPGKPSLHPRICLSEESDADSHQGIDLRRQPPRQERVFSDVFGPIPNHIQSHCQSDPAASEFSEEFLQNNSNMHDNTVSRESRFIDLSSVVGDYGEEEDLERDIYSLLMISSLWTLSFFYSLIVASCQFFITSLILIDLLVDDRVVGVRDDNPLNVPSKVEWPVACAQFLSLIIAFVSVDDIITSMKMFVIGYDQNIHKQNPGATYCKFLLANLIRFVEGMCTIFVSVVIVVVSNNVLEIFMNFAAVAFVSKLDNLAFQLAQDGLRGERLRLACKRVEETKVVVQRKKIGWAINLLFFLLFLPFLSILTLTTTRQNNGYMLATTSCKNLDVQFGDEMYEFPEDVVFSFKGSGNNKTFPNSKRELPFLEEKPSPLLYQYFSGIYVAETAENSNRLKEFNSRPIYWERGNDNDPTSGKFYYCEALKSWVFTIEALYYTDGVIPQEVRDECEWGWLLQSPMTTALTLEEAPMKGWNIWVGDVQEVDSAFRIACADCQRNSDCGLTHGRCDVDSGTCICYGEWQGRRCDQMRPYCPGLTFLEYGESSHNFTEFFPLILVMDDTNNAQLLYERPMYTKNVFFDDFDFFVQVALMYTGRRWFVAMWFPEDVEMLEGIDFHGYWDNAFGKYTYYFSDPTENYLPTGFSTWNAVRFSESRGNFGPFGASYPIIASAECLAVDCVSDDSICGLHGTCTKGMIESAVLGNSTDNITLYEGFERHYCECSHNFGGFYCEYAPYGPYSGEMYAEYILDPVSYYHNNAHLEYLKYWVNHSVVEDSNNQNIGENATIEGDVRDGS